MELAHVELQTYEVELLTRNFQLSGKMTPLGDMLSYMNDARRSTLVVQEAEATPLLPDWRISPFSRPEVVLPLSEVQIVLVTGLEASDLQLLPHTEQLVVYTDTYAVNGHFHTGSDTKVNDFFYITDKPFFAASNAEAHSLKSLTVPIGGTAPILFLNKAYVSGFHIA